MRPLALAVLLIVACFVATDTRANAQASFALGEDDVVVFLGGTNMLHLQQAGHLEAMLTHAFADARPKFRDFSWEADTVFRQGTVIDRWRNKGHFGGEGLGDLNRQLQQVGATVVIRSDASISFCLRNRRPHFDSAELTAWYSPRFQSRARLPNSLVVTASVWAPAAVSMDATVLTISFYPAGTCGR